MKYVVLDHPTKMAVVVASLGLTHAELVAPYLAKGYTPTSAGFLSLAGEIATAGYSASLKLTPSAHDAQLITALWRAQLVTAPEAGPAAAAALPSSQL